MRSCRDCQRLHYAHPPDPPTCKFCARTTPKFVIPRTKHIASRMLDFPDPFRPVIELKLSSLPIVSAGTVCDSWVNKPAGNDCTDSVRLVALEKVSDVVAHPFNCTDVYDQLYDLHGGRMCCCCQSLVAVLFGAPQSVRCARLQNRARQGSTFDASRVWSVTPQHHHCDLRRGKLLLGLCRLIQVQYRLEARSCKYSRCSSPEPFYEAGRMLSVSQE